MPKKFRGENSKSTEAKARKAAVADEAADRKKKELEDAYWEDDDKHLAKKAQRKDDKEKKRQEQLERKKELAQLHDQEMEAVKGTSKSQPAAPKVTRHQLELRKKALEEAAAAERAKDKSITVQDDEEPLEENLNRLSVEGEARTVDQAISLLSQTSVEEAAVDRHPEKRVKAAYQEFESRRLPELKQENGNLRLSQLKQILKKEWQKSPENPLNAHLRN